MFSRLRLQKTFAFVTIAFLPFECMEVRETTRRSQVNLEDVAAFLEFDFVLQAVSVISRDRERRQNLVVQLGPETYSS